jgi:hypothetical protein
MPNIFQDQVKFRQLLKVARRIGDPEERARLIDR